MEMQLQWAEKKDVCDVSPKDFGVFASVFGFRNGNTEPSCKESGSRKSVCATEMTA